MISFAVTHFAGFFIGQLLWVVFPREDLKCHSVHMGK